MQSDTILEKSNIIIGDSGKTPNIKSKIYGSGIYDQVQESNITIILVISSVSTFFKSAAVLLI